MRGRGLDTVILTLFCLLVLFGFVVLSSASSDIGKSKFDDPYYYVTHQAIYGLTLGVLGFLAGLFFPYEKYRKLAPFILLAAVVLLILTFTPLGFSSGGAARWISFGPITFQPAEILKFAFITYLAAWLAGGRVNRQKDFANGFLPFLMMCGFIGSLLILQRSTSSLVIIMAASLALYITSGARVRYAFYIVGLGALALSLIIVFTPYRLQRVMTFFNPSLDTSGAGYQINQAKITIGSGGIAGLGYGNSFSKTFLPERIGDSIFAIIAEEFGFIGASSLILMYLAILIRSYLDARNVRDLFGRLLLVGFASVIGAQAFMHIGAISGLIPLTGVPLPFISYGGTALAVFMTAVGVMLNITKRG